jgi:hypothetical protein
VTGDQVVAGRHEVGLLGTGGVDRSHEAQLLVEVVQGDRDVDLVEGKA